MQKISFIIFTFYYLIKWFFFNVGIIGKQNNNNNKIQQCLTFFFLRPHSKVKSICAESTTHHKKVKSTCAFYFPHGLLRELKTANFVICGRRKILYITSEKVSFSLVLFFALGSASCENIATCVKFVTFYTCNIIYYFNKAL